MLWSWPGHGQGTGPLRICFLSNIIPEIVMDISDVAGDAASGVQTLPVLLGRQFALLAATAAFASASAVVAYAACYGSGLSWLVRPRSRCTSYHNKRYISIKHNAASMLQCAI